MARLPWQIERSRAQKEGFEYFRETVTFTSGNRRVTCDAVVDTAIDEADARSSGDPQQREAAYPVAATVTVNRFDLGWLPVIGEEIRICRQRYPAMERLYIVIDVDDSSDDIDFRCEARAHGGGGRNTY